MFKQVSMLRICSATKTTERDPNKSSAEYIMPSIQVVRATHAESKQSSKGCFIAESHEYDELENRVMEFEADDGVKVGSEALMCDSCDHLNNQCR